MFHEQNFELSYSFINRLFDNIVSTAIMVAKHSYYSVILNNEKKMPNYDSNRKQLSSPR